MPYDKPKSEAYLLRKARLNLRRQRQKARKSMINPAFVARFAAHWKAVRNRNGVGRPSKEKRAGGARG